LICCSFYQPFGSAYVYEKCAIATEAVTKLESLITNGFS